MSKLNTTENYFLLNNAITWQVDDRIRELSDSFMDQIKQKKINIEALRSNFDPISHVVYWQIGEAVHASFRGY